MLPRNVFGVRHGYSVANWLTHLEEQRQLDDRLSRLLRETPNHLHPLMPKGIEQAVAAGRWLKKFGELVDPTILCSEFARAMQTAGIIGREIQLQRPLRFTSRLGERDWGLFQELPVEQQDAEYLRRKANPRHWKPLNGESMRDLNRSVRDILDTLHREPSERDVVLVSHGEFLTGMSEEIEHWMLDELGAAITEGVPNCGIIQYTRVNPQLPSDVREKMCWKRRICPWNKRWKSGQWNGEWQEVTRPKLGWEEVLKLVEEKYPLPAGLESQA